ncbi:MAG: bifunctional hydroxymethylpyrimidine kinase/phosphomethylpyrimidine kinase [Deltaproteobacteria bacterium]|nr:bifunctional hydroxymethylpyrimidine kinase/phosphomethylpyrimidine kinase [Deltaproteobacteria bacterium]
MITILTIAGSDSSGGAGIQADIKTIHRLGAHALCAVTAVTTQGSRGLSSVHPVPPGEISRQIEVAVADAFPGAVKIGMLKSPGAVKTVASLIERFRLSNVVLDPVITATAGGRLLDVEALETFLSELVPRADVVTPNIEEASLLSGRPVQTLEEAEEAARSLKSLGPDVVVTGGHFPDQCVDLLFDGKGVHRFPGSRLQTTFTHGSGCVFSSALATCLGMGADLHGAVARARETTREALRLGYACGSAPGVVNPLGGCVRGGATDDADIAKQGTPVDQTGLRNGES